ncbi:hypothetical protein [Micromonospora radicis]|nr:hypothetical protein [Micromonospora radicis]
MAILAEWGYPEPGDLGPREAPSIIGHAVDLLASRGTTLDELALRAAIPVDLLQIILAAGTLHLLDRQQADFMRS